MRLGSRFLIAFAAALVASAAAAQTDFPSRQIRLITPFAPGGAIDVLTRTIAERLALRFGQPVVVDAIPGASTIIGTQALVKAPADGHTFMITTMSTAVNNPVMYPKLLWVPAQCAAHPIARPAPWRVPVLSSAPVTPMPLGKLAAMQVCPFCQA